MIDGKLTGEGKVTQNIQVVFEGTDLTSKLAREDEEGSFLTALTGEEQTNQRMVLSSITQRTERRAS